MDSAPEGERNRQSCKYWKISMPNGVFGGVRRLVFPALLDYYDDIHPWRTFSLNC